MLDAFLVDIQQASQLAVWEVEHSRDFMVVEMDGLEPSLLWNYKFPPLCQLSYISIDEVTWGSLHHIGFLPRPPTLLADFFTNSKNTAQK